MAALVGKRWVIFWAALLLATAVAACAPAAGAGVGVEAGDFAPPFAMQLTDGSEVTLKDLVDGERPTLMMYFATW